LRIDNPASEVPTSVGQGTGREAQPTRDVGKVRASDATRAGTVDGVAEHAGAGQEDAKPVALLVGRGLRGGLPLMCLPTRELFLWLGKDVERHMGMLQATELGALAAEHPGPVGLQMQRVHLARDQVLLALEVRHPEAVDHVNRA
jgi:hypothetical protein